MVNQIEMKSIEFDDYVWKILSYPSENPNKALISSYSFTYLEEDKPIEEIEFTSKLICVDENSEIVWELPGKNIEHIKLMEKQESLLIFAGTTVGEILIIDPKTGEITFEINQKSCTNMVNFLTTTNIVFSCHDDGTLYAYFFEDF